MVVLEGVAVSYVRSAPVKLRQCLWQAAEPLGPGTPSRHVASWARELERGLFSETSGRITPGRGFFSEIPGRDTPGGGVFLETPGREPPVTFVFPETPVFSP